MRITSDQRLSPVQNFVVAGTAAAIGRLAVNPFSMAKIWGEAGRPGGKMGPIMALYWIGRTEGMAGFMKGAPVAVARIFPHIGIQCALYDQKIRKEMNMPIIAKPSLERTSTIFYWGGVANLVATSITHPLDVIKTRMVLQPNASVYANSFDAAVKILKQEGIFGLYRGLFPSLIGGFLFSGSLFALWDLSDNLPWRRRNAKPIIYFEWFVIPCVATAVACTVSQPFDVLRRKIMATGKSIPKGTFSDVNASGLFTAVFSTFHKSGTPGFLHGMFSNWLKVVPQVAAIFFVFGFFPDILASGSSLKKKNEALL